MSEKHKCCEMVWAQGSYRGYPCGKGANYEHEGKHYCKTHHPPTITAKRDAERDRQNRLWDIRREREQSARDAAAEQKRRADAYEGLIALNANLVSVLKGALHCVHSEGHPFRHWHLEAATVLERAAQQTKEDSHE
jgi:hypothetical protein